MFDVHKYFHEWIDEMGSESHNESSREAREWLEAVEIPEEQLVKMVNCLAENVTNTMMLEIMEGDIGTLFTLGPRIASVAFRFGLAVEAKKHMPEL